MFSSKQPHVLCFTSAVLLCVCWCTASGVMVVQFMMPPCTCLFSNLSLCHTANGQPFITYTHVRTHIHTLAPSLKAWLQGHCWACRMLLLIFGFNLTSEFARTYAYIASKGWDPQCKLPCSTLDRNCVQNVENDELKLVSPHSGPSG